METILPQENLPFLDAFEAWNSLVNVKVQKNPLLNEFRKGNRSYGFTFFHGFTNIALGIKNFLDTLVVWVICVPLDLQLAIPQRIFSLQQILYWGKRISTANGHDSSMIHHGLIADDTFEFVFLAHFWGISPTSRWTSSCQKMLYRCAKRDASMRFFSTAVSTQSRYIPDIKTR